MANRRQNPGRKWRQIQKNEDGDMYNKNFQYTPYTTDLGFFSDPEVYQADQVARTTQDEAPETDRPSAPRGSTRTDQEMQQEIQELLAWQGQLDPAGIQLDVRQGVVTLSGQVDSPGMVQAVEGIVRNVLGVRRVNNRLEVRQQAT